MFFFFPCADHFLPRTGNRKGSQRLLSLRLLNERLISFRTLSDYKFLCVCVCCVFACARHRLHANTHGKRSSFPVTPALPAAAAFLRRGPGEGDALRLHRCCDTLKGPPETFVFCLSSPRLVAPTSRPLRSSSPSGIKLIALKQPRCRYWCTVFLIMHFFFSVIAAKQLHSVLRDSLQRRRRCLRRFVVNCPHCVHVSCAAGLDQLSVVFGIYIFFNPNVPCKGCFVPVEDE